MALTKSYSNYVLRKKHQNVNDGTIYERDITTIGGLNQFSKGQTPIYKDGNFIITVRNDGGVSNQYNTNKWEENENGTVWTLESVSGLTSKIDDENDLKIVLKQDYYDFNDFAYYGSLSELFRASVNDIVSRFPGELYYEVSGNPVYYTSSYTVDFNVIEESIRLGGDNMYEVTNPFSIDIHNVTKPKEADKLKYFAEGGFLNYRIICDDGEPLDICKWQTKVFNVVVLQRDELDRIYGDDYFYKLYLANYLNDKKFWNSDNSNEVWWYTCKKMGDGSYEVEQTSKDVDGSVVEDSDSGFTNIVKSFEEGEIYSAWETYETTKYHVYYDNDDLQIYTISGTTTNKRPTVLSYSDSYVVSGSGTTKRVTVSVSGNTSGFPISYSQYDAGATNVIVYGNVSVSGASGWSNRIEAGNKIDGLLNVFSGVVYSAICNNTRMYDDTYDAYKEVIYDREYREEINRVSADTYNAYINDVYRKTYNDVYRKTYDEYITGVSADTYDEVYRETYDELIEQGYSEEEADAQAIIAATSAATEAAESEETKEAARASANTAAIASATTKANSSEVKRAARASATTKVNKEEVKAAARDVANNYVNGETGVDEITSLTRTKVNSERARIARASKSTQSSKFRIVEYSPDKEPFHYMTYVYKCKGNKIAIVKLYSGTTDGDCEEIDDEKEGDLIIEGWIGDNNTVYYLSKDTFNYHIHPMSDDIDYFTEFYNECDNFEKLLMNPNTTPKYKATFSVIKENDYGYYRELEDFIFPTTYGGYNIDVESYGFSNYTTRMVQIGEFYDERFTDNMWRSMTHEAIKNFDWTYTREYQDGDEEENVIGGQKMQKALRVFAREFDEIITYINNIKSSNRVTYDERGNIPDYFLTDVVENEGWDVKLVYPYTLKEYFKDDKDKKVVPFSAYTEIGQLSNSAITDDEDGLIVREFSQNATLEVMPYSQGMIYDGTENGYFIVCHDTVTGDIVPSDCLLYNYDSSIYDVIKASGNTMPFSGRGATKYRIKSYTDERPYTYNAVNNEFLRRLKINSRHIWRHKGTIEAMEMVLGMFGLRSKRFNDRLGICKANEIPDYEIIEYSSFAKYINDPWDAVNQMYRIDWINSTKTITYDNRFISNNNPYGRSGLYSVYEGIPVAYRDVENWYIKKGPIGTQEFTDESDDIDIFRKIDDDNSLVHERRLYPKFDKGEKYDGDPYFQMDGGWLSKKIKRDGDETVEEDSGMTCNFQYDLNNNIVYTDYLPKGESDESGNIKDNEFLYKETIRNIRRFDNLSKLLSVPTSELWNGIICYVSSVESGIAVIEGKIYNVNKKYEQVSGINKVTESIELVKGNGYIRVGNKFFDEAITVYNKDGVMSTVALNDKPEGYSLDAYIINGNFVCSDYSGSMYSIDSFVYMGEPSDDDTNYFTLDDVNFADSIAQKDDDGNWSSGWRRLKNSDKEYFKINTMENYYKGNNPHSGNMVYDNGHEYFTYFKRLFKYPVDNYLFDERCYYDFYDSLDNEIAKYGFGGLIEDNEDILQYDTFLKKDTKIHYFGDYKRKPTTSDNVVSHACFYGDNDTESIKNKKEKWEDIDTGNTSDSYILKDDSMIGGSPYSSETYADEVTNQIVNNKRMTIRFNLHYAWYTVSGQEEIKFIDDIVLNYLTQVIPSTTILDVVYISAK